MYCVSYVQIFPSIKKMMPGYFQPARDDGRIFPTTTLKKKIGDRKETILDAINLYFNISLCILFTLANFW